MFGALCTQTEYRHLHRTPSSLTAARAMNNAYITRQNTTKTTQLPPTHQTPPKHHAQRTRGDTAGRRNWDQNREQPNRNDTARKQRHHRTKKTTTQYDASTKEDTTRRIPQAEAEYEPAACEDKHRVAARQHAYAKDRASPRETPGE